MGADIFLMVFLMAGEVFLNFRIGISPKNFTETKNPDINQGLGWDAKGSDTQYHKASVSPMTNCTEVHT